MVSYPIKERQLKLRSTVLNTGPFHIQIFGEKMLRSEVNVVSSSTRRRSSSGSPGYENAKRSRRDSVSDYSDNDDDQRQDDDEEEEEEGEVEPKQNAKPPTTTAPSRTGGLYMPPAKLRLLQVRFYPLMELNS